MRTIAVIGNETIRIGRVGENRAVQIIWPGLLEKWRELYGEGTVQLAARRPKDAAPYPVVCEVSENDVTWTVQAADTARHGIGECELTYLVGEKIAKSQTWATEILRSLTEDEMAEPPDDPAKTWYMEMRQEIGDLDNLETDDKSSLVAAINEAAQSSGGSGTLDHAKLTGRDAADQHPMSAITGLEKALEDKQPAGAYLTEESDPTVPDWAKAAHKPSYTASEVGADPSGTASDLVAVHNTGTDTHSDIRLLVQGLTDRLNALADSDDTTLDQLSEVVAYIKSNRDLIEAVTTAKVNVADIIDNLTTNVANKPLSASQGVVLKALIDAITIPEKLPNPNALTFTGAASATYDGSEAVTVEISSGGGGGSSAFMIDTTTEEEVSSMSWTLPAKWKKILILNIHITVPSQDTDMSLYAKFGDANNSYKSIGTLKSAAINGVDIYLLRMNENYMGLGQSVVQTYPSNARPAIPSTSITPSSDSDQMMLYSNTSGINFPTGTIFKIWGVYAP